jgi:ATP-dependent helicase/nuclease subunit B
MSLQLIYGKSGTGKTKYIFDEIALKQTTLAEKIYIITPEQFSYTAEKKLLETSKSSSIMNCEVISFKNICNRILNEVGGITKTHLSQSGKAMLIYSILENEKKNLKFLGNSKDNIDLILDILSEFKKNNITLDKLKNTKEQLQSKYLEEKLTDIENIYSKYQMMIDKDYIDEDELLTIISKKIDQSNMFGNSEIYIDEFSSFTRSTVRINKKIVKTSKKSEYYNMLKP